MRERKIKNRNKEIKRLPLRKTEKTEINFFFNNSPTGVCIVQSVANARLSAR